VSKCLVVIYPGISCSMPRNLLSPGWCMIYRGIWPLDTCSLGIKQQPLTHHTWPNFPQALWENVINYTIIYPSLYNQSYMYHVFYKFIQMSWIILTKRCLTCKGWQHYSHVIIRYISLLTFVWFVFILYLLIIIYCQWLATGQWFSPGTPVSSTNKLTTTVQLK
jgi:hypothetical protein